MDFMTLPDGPVRLKNLTVPACLMDRPGDLLRVDFSLSGGQIAIEGGTEFDMQGAMVFPAFVDMHTHLDKGHIWDRAPNPDGTFPGALSTVTADREANWCAEDVRTRMEFALKCAYAHGTRAIRTHLDSIPPQDEISWAVFRELRDEWAGRIDLQAACLVGCDRMEANGAFRKTADIVAESGGVLGMVLYPAFDLRERLAGFLRLATERGLAVDFHVDETMDPESETLRLLGETVLETGFSAAVTVGHCCSLSTQDTTRAFDTLDLVAKAGFSVVSLPMCNLYLQDRHRDRTPRARGITLVHEMKARGINVSFASDNTRDPFYAYGDLDMLEVMRQATRIGHLDHSADDWSHAFIGNPAHACGFDKPTLVPGEPADLVIFKARSWTELFARPQMDRIVLRAGRQIDRTLPSYCELDHLMRTQ
ncbi:cytosine deaminase [Litoreibacter roseus]|uniref:Amidohydrolase n=1 Tax=Litoreibacter roseus TaxID=2601869 RepID=A0A6N6JGB9_9RHOB|nr:cytosine deaminase [Litoreibacter roseus]GFE65175.1 amidohydrolase [Litoreibacter roseus]